MAQAKQDSSKNSLRQMLLNNGAIRSGDIQPSYFKHTSKEDSRAAAIAARKHELRHFIPVTSNPFKGSAS